MRKHPWIRLLALVLLASPASTLAQDGSTTIRGRVFAADNRQALARARVTITADGSAGLPAYTDDRGEFSMAAPAAATFMLSVVKAGYVASQMPLRRSELASAGSPALEIALTRSAAVNGRVVDTTGETVVGLRVYADRLDPAPSTQAGLVKFATTADDRGEYRIGGLPPGRYSVTAVGAQDPGAVATLDLQPGDDLTAVDFTALPPRESAMVSSPQPPETPERATIRGRVLSASGRAIATATVSITGPMPPRFFVTDARGRFTFTALAPGDYEVSASRGDFLPTPSGQDTLYPATAPGGLESARRITVSPGARVDDVTLTLSRGLAVTGTIVDRNGEPVQGVAVQAPRLSTSGDRRRAVLAGAQVGGGRQTDDRGQYRVLGLLPGTYVIAAMADASSLGGGATTSQPLPIYFPGSASIADAVTVTISTADAEGLDFALADTPAHRIAGVVLDAAGAPFEGTVTLAVSHRSGGIIPTPRPTRSGRDGTFTFFNVAPGDYVVQAAKLLSPGQTPARGEDLLANVEFAVQFVTVGAADAEPILLRTARGSVMEGRMIVDAPVPDDPYNRLQIEGHPVDPDLAPASLVMSGNTPRGTDGRFRLGALTGPRRIVLSGLPDGWYLKAVTVNGSDVTDEVIDFGVGASRTVVGEVTISAAGGSIAGRVTSERRTPLTGSRVIVFPDDRGKWFERSRFVKAVRASQDGSFRASSLPPGDYYVAANTAAAGSDEPPTEADFERLLSRATRVTLNEGEDRRVDISLP